MATSWADVIDDDKLDIKDDEKQEETVHPSNGNAKKRRKKKKVKETEEEEVSDGKEGGWETFGGRKKERVDKSAKAPSLNKPMKANNTQNKGDLKEQEATTPFSRDFKSQRWLFVAPIQDLNEDMIRHFFTENHGEVASIIAPVNPKLEPPKPSHCYILFKDLKVVEKLVEKHYENIPITGSDQRKRVEMKKYDPDPKKFWDKKKLDEEKLLVESLLQTKNIPRNVKFVEKRSGLPKYFTTTQEYSWPLIVENTSIQDRTLLKVYCVSKLPEFMVFDKIPRRGKGEGSVTLSTGQKHEIILKYTPRQFGIVTQRLVFEFTSFQMTYEVIMKVGSEEEMKIMEENLNESQKLDEVSEVKRIIVPAFPSNRTSSLLFPTNAHIEAEWIEKLPEYSIPENIQVDSEKHSLDFNPWSVKENYKKKLHTLLFVEEAHQKLLIRNFDLRDVEFDEVHSYEHNNITISLPEPCSRLLFPGLADRRPMISPGDVIYVWTNDKSEKEFEGIVYLVESDALYVVFAPEFHSTFQSKTKFNIRFTLNRMKMRLMHHAIDTVNLNLVWPPEEVKSKEERRGNGKGKTSQKNARDSTKQSVKWIDSSIKNNDQAAQAVANILTNTNGIVPFLIFGPFGTGKTRSIIELVKQLISRDKATSILICAPSNSAADQYITELQLDEKTILRLYPYNRNKNLVSPSMLKFSNFDEKKELFTSPIPEIVKSFRVIVTTPTASASLFNIGINNKIFSHIILDEAAQMMEPEALIPISLASESTSIIMTGDDKRLGPNILSPSARRHGLATSIMERLLSLPIYKKRKDPHVAVELIRNYTIHPKILDFVSRFYETKLQSVADPGKTNLLLNWSKLPNKKFPILFYAVTGEDKAEGQSIFNALEASAVAGLVDSLISEQKIAATDIGIISPHSKQVQKLRLVLGSKGLGDIKVGRIEELRGNTYKAIFISTVSSKNYSEEMQDISGLLENHKEMNSSLQLASALVVVVGDPTILATDTNWKDFIDYCQQNQSFIGLKISTHHDEAEELEQTDGDILETSKEDSTESVLMPQDQVSAEAVVEEKNREEEVFDKGKDETELEPKEPINNQPDANSTQQHEVAIEISENPEKQDSVEVSSQGLSSSHQRESIPPQGWNTPYPYQGMPVGPQLQAVLQGNIPPEMMYPPSPMMLPMPQNPMFLPPLPFPSTPDSYIWMHSINGHQFIGYNKEGGYPPLTVTDKGDAIEIDISLFNCLHSLHCQGNFIYINIFQNLQSDFFVPTIFTQPDTKAPIAEMIISVPIEFDMRLMDIAVSRTVMLIILPRRHPLAPHNPTTQTTPKQYQPNIDGNA